MPEDAPRPAQAAIHTDLHNSHSLPPVVTRRSDNGRAWSKKGGVSRATGVYGRHAAWPCPQETTFTEILKLKFVQDPYPSR